MIESKQQLLKNEVKIPLPLEGIELPGELIIPEGATKLVIFSHGSGSSRLSPRNRMVAKKLRKEKIGTLLFDLLTPEEGLIHSKRFDITLLTKRLIETTTWLVSQSEIANMKIGYFGASTGAASALRAAAELPNIIDAVASRGGRPNLAMDALPMVKSPTLLIVGGLDFQVITMNQDAYKLIAAEKKMEIITGATHLFEESSKLENVAELAINWFNLHLV